MADKHDRTQAIADIYQTFLQELDPMITPMISKNNSDELLFDNPKVMDRKNNPGLSSGLIYETANDPNAGRSTSRKFAHLSEVAFYRYHKEIDDGVQNSIPLADDTCIIKESTANGRGGVGKLFYTLWNAAKRGESLYQPFFVAWYEVDDYALSVPRDFKPTQYEKDILKQHPDVTEANLMWRRLKIKEYLNDDEDTILTPEERFKQDFPIDDIEAFLSTGAPVFDQHVLASKINQLNQFKPNEFTDRINLNSYLLKEFKKDLKIYSPPRKGESYFIGADVSEGLAQGDASSVYVMNNNRKQVARWHGKIDPDLFGFLLIDIAKLFNDALITCENNNMGHTTITTMRNEGYSKTYKEVIEDKVTKKKTERLGWRTTVKSKQDMLNEAVRSVREDDSTILDVKLLEEMSIIARGENGSVDLNGRDRVVAFCLALMGHKHFKAPIKTTKKVNMETGNAGDIMRELAKKSRSGKIDIFS